MTAGAVLPAAFAPTLELVGSGKQLPPWMRAARGVTVGVALAMVMILTRWSGLVHGKLALAIFVLAMLAIPTSRQLSRRILLSACLAFGWVPLLWWWPLPVGDLGRGTLLLAVMVGGLGGWAAGGQHPWARCRAVMPKLAVVDAYPFLLALFGAAVLYPWLRPKSGPAALSMLMGGWDNSAHFNMVHQIRQTGVTVDVAPYPASEGIWHFYSYPESFHAVSATVIEFLTGPRVGDLSTELVVFSQTMAIMTICFIGMLVAGICALPLLRRRPALALPVSTFVAAIFLFGPGSVVIQEGFVNFNFACALVAAGALMTVSMARVFSPLHLAAIGGAVIGVANGWILLLVLAAPVILIGLLPFKRSRWSSSRRKIVISVVIVAAVFLCVARGVVVVLRVPVDNVLLVKGGVTPPNIGLTLVAVLSCLALSILVGKRYMAAPNRPARGQRARVRALVWLPIVATLAAGYIGVLQLRNGDALTYYFMKFVTGIEIVCFIVLVIPLSIIIARWIPSRQVYASGGSGTRWFVPHRISLASTSAIAASLAMTIAATQAFGFASPDLTARALPPTAPGAISRVYESTRILAPPAASSNLIDVAQRLNSEYPGKPMFYFDFPSDRQIDPILAAQWYFALTNTWYRASNNLVVNADFYAYTPVEVASSARRILTARPDAYVAVAADQVALIRGWMPASVPVEHIVGW